MEDIYNNLFEMMNSRNYNSNDKKVNNIKVEDFNIIFKDNNKNKIFCFYIDNTKIGINHIKQIIQTLDEKSDKHALVIHSLPVTSFAKQFIETSEYEIEMFNSKELSKNITKHFLVPKHTLLNKIQAVELTNQLQITKSHLPKIKKSDPISRYYNAQQNDIFEITRYDNNIKSLYYRLVYT